MAPMVHGLEAQYAGKIQFTYLDADDSRTQEFQRALGFRYQPEFYLLDAQGAVLQKWVGYVSREEFESVFRLYVSN
jgi:thioredoxin-related protein